MLSDSEKLMTRVAFEKWMNSEPLTLSDLDRLIYVFEHCNLAVDTANQAAQINSLMKFRTVLQQRFFPPPQQ